MPQQQRGNKDISQLRDTIKTGGDTGERVVTNVGDIVPGHGGKWDDDSNWVDNGLPANTLASGTHTEILTDSHGPITESTGDFIYVVGVPN